MNEDKEFWNLEEEVLADMWFYSECESGKLETQIKAYTQKEKKKESFN